MTKPYTVRRALLEAHFSANAMTDDHTRKIKLDTLREVQKVLAFAMSDTSTLARTTAANAISKMIEELQ
jgi:hypothetical protein